MGNLDFRLLNDFQRGFPLVREPYVELARQLDSDESSVLAALARLLDGGAISRVGAVFAPRRVGASTLAALAVPPERLETVAEQVSAYPEVNHNYERENDYNLWFVATAPSAERLDQVIENIATTTACPLIRLPLQEEFHIDLGFDLNGGAKLKRQVHSTPAQPPETYCALPLPQQNLMMALQDGLALSATPYAHLAGRANMSEEEVLGLLSQWLEEGLIKRFGIVVRHQELGYNANAMCVWDVPDSSVQAIGQSLAGLPGITLCYRRARHLPDWPYNLYCMIHGRERAEVERLLKQISEQVGLGKYPGAVLFSLRRYKQRGARYTGAMDAAHSADETIHG